MIFLIILPLKYIFCLVGAIFVIVILNTKTGEVRSNFVETSQTRDEIMRRNASALAKNGDKVTSRRTRGGFTNQSSDKVVSGQIIKKK